MQLNIPLTEDLIDSVGALNATINRSTVTLAGLSAVMTEVCEQYDIAEFADDE